MTEQQAMGILRATLPVDARFEVSKMATATRLDSGGPVRRKREWRVFALWNEPLTKFEFSKVAIVDFLEVAVQQVLSAFESWRESIEPYTAKLEKNQNSGMEAKYARPIKAAR